MADKMIGKKNIVFGFIYLVLTAALGPYMIKNFYPALTEAQVSKQESLGRLQSLEQNDFEEELEVIGVGQLSRANTHGLLALNRLGNARAPIDAMKGGAHAHGNLEALLNIVVGVVLCFVAAPSLVKQLISWVFILGALLHSGLLYLRSFDVRWAGELIATGVGPVLVLLGLLAMGIVSAVWLRGEIVQDR